MKYLLALVIFVCLSISSIFSQVKRQYVDQENTTTTVVVKENNVSDVQILNSQFNLNSVGMGEVIKIKTENLQPKGAAEVPQAEVPQAEVPLAEVPQAEIPMAEVPVSQVVQAESPKPIIAPPPTSVPQVIKNTTTPNPKVVSPPRAQQKSTEIYYQGTGSYGNRKLKMKKRKVKKRKKIKKRRKRKITCPSF
ncbi:MAG: hypothetical protein AAF573_11220 [Bacteroidota bacterium]